MIIPVHAIPQGYNWDDVGHDLYVSERDLISLQKQDPFIGGSSRRTDPYLFLFPDNAS